MDRCLQQQRSALMARVRHENTAPELLVRRILFAAGYRYRLHRRDLAGTPDLTLPALRTVVFVHGCFWHRHRGCRASTFPKTNIRFWADKFKANQMRDARNVRQLRRLGWQCLTVWECETRRPEKLKARLFRLLATRTRQARGKGRVQREIR